MLPEKALCKNYNLRFHAPETMEETLRLLNAHPGDALLMAGASDLMPKIRNGIISTDNLVSLGRIGELTRLHHREDGALLLGSMVTQGRLEEAALVQQHWPVLAEAAAMLSCRSIRNVGTIGGNICNASPAADLVPPLMILEAGVTVKNAENERIIPITDFFKGPGETVLDAAEVVTAIVVPPVPVGWGDCYLKLGNRNAMEISIVAVGAGLALEQNRICKEARIALGAVGPVPFRVAEAEQLLVGKILEKDCPEIVFAAQAAAAESRPITDLRASAAYRKEMIEVFTRRALNRALERSQGGVSIENNN